MIDTCAISSI